MRRASRAIIIKDNQLLVTKRNKFGRIYYTLPGGGVDFGEDELQALKREMAEEACVEYTNPRLVFTEAAGPMYGFQSIFLCDYAAGEPALRPDSIEAEISAGGKNLYEPMWLPLSELPNIPFRSERLKMAILNSIEKGWPVPAVDITDSGPAGDA